MYKMLRPESPIVKYGVPAAALTYALADGASLNDNPYMGGAFLLACGAGSIDGKTPTGVVTQYSLSMCGYGFMAVNAWQQKNYPELVSAFGGFVACTRTIANNFPGSVYDQQLSKLSVFRNAKHYLQTTPVGTYTKQAFDTVSEAPANLLRLAVKPCQTSKHETIRDFGQNIDEISRRPLFAGALFASLCDLGYLWSGHISHDKTKRGSGVGWLLGSLFSAIAVPKEGEKNVFRAMFDVARDAITGQRHHNDNDGPATPGTPQVA